MSKELKPCPFCGSRDVRVMQLSTMFRFFCACNSCHATTGEYVFKEEAIKAWNRRPSPWHTGTPTEEGDYLLLVDKGMPRYTLGRWSGHWEFPNQDFVIAWQKIEPFKESE